MQRRTGLVHYQDLDWVGCRKFVEVLIGVVEVQDLEEGEEHLMQEEVDIAVVVKHYQDIPEVLFEDNYHLEDQDCKHFVEVELVKVAVDNLVEDLGLHTAVVAGLENSAESQDNLADLEEEVHSYLGADLHQEEHSYQAEEDNCLVLGVVHSQIDLLMDRLVVEEHLVDHTDLVVLDHKLHSEVLDKQLQDLDYYKVDGTPAVAVAAVDMSADSLYTAAVNLQEVLKIIDIYCMIKQYCNFPLPNQKKKYMKIVQSGSAVVRKQQKPLQDKNELSYQFEIFYKYFRDIFL